MGQSIVNILLAFAIILVSVAGVIRDVEISGLKAQVKEIQQEMRGD